MFKFIRIAILLTVLLVVAGSQWLTGNRLVSWDKPLWVTVFPVLAQSDSGVRRYTEGLSADSFHEVAAFIKHQAERYGRKLDRPVVIQVARPLSKLPPALPPEASGWKVALWSLKMRWWSWKNGRQDDLAPADVNMFVLYKTGGTTPPMERSVGVKNGSYGIVNAAASPQWAARNRIVIAHELLHIIGATDKYDFITGQPFAPDGLARPSQSPLYPQNRAEIMGGRIAVSASNWRRPASLKFCDIGSRTATEIGWLPGG